MTEKVVCITGASSGIGAATAEAFAALGARLLLAARRRDRIETNRGALLAKGAGDIHALELDVRDSDAVATAFETLPEEWREIDVLVNNAGLSRGLDPLYKGKLDDWNEMIDTNVKGLLYVTRAVLPGMVARNRGHVINIGSTAGRITYPKGAVYCASKAAERVISEGLRDDLYTTAVRTTTVDPGMVETDFSRVRFRGDEAKAAKVYENLTPLRPQDVAEAIVFAATRPVHVNIAEIVITPTAQANSLLIHRGDSPD